MTGDKDQPEEIVADVVIDGCFHDEIPRKAELASRLASVLEVIYLIFNEGYSAAGGADWMRPALCEEALRLGRILAELTPEEPEVHGLIALMEIQAARGLRTRSRQRSSHVTLERLPRNRRTGPASWHSTTNSRASHRRRSWS